MFEILQKGKKMDVNVKSILCDIERIKYIPGDHYVVQGVKNKDAAKFENSHNCSGGCGSYGVNTSSELNIYFTELKDKDAKVLNISSLLRSVLDIRNYTEKRRRIIIENKPSQLIFDKIFDNSRIRYYIKEDDEKFINWIKELKKLL